MKKLVIAVLAFWLITGAVSLSWNLIDDKSEHERLTLEAARSFFDHIVLTRTWNSNTGGIYVPISEDYQPNPYLVTPNRDITTTDGRKLTMINPAYMTRQISEIATLQEGVQFHITSLSPLRPENIPTEWEREWLKDFEKGFKEKFALVNLPLQENLWAPSGNGKFDKGLYHGQGMLILPSSIKIEGQWRHGTFLDE